MQTQGLSFSNRAGFLPVGPPRPHPQAPQLQDLLGINISLTSRVLLNSCSLQPQKSQQTFMMTLQEVIRRAWRPGRQQQRLGGRVCPFCLQRRSWPLHHSLDFSRRKADRLQIEDNVGADGGPPSGAGVGRHRQPAVYSRSRGPSPNKRLCWSACQPPGVLRSPAGCGCGPACWSLRFKTARSFQ